MFNSTVKSLFIGSILAISTCGTALAQIPTIPKDFQAPVRSKFSCGSHMKTYVVRSLNNVKGKGIRCVKFGQPRPLAKRRLPAIAWYGEGNWQGKTYRHVGHAFGRNRQNLKGYASDIFGNGEDFKGNFPGNLKIQVINSSRIRVTGAWNEEWIALKATNYKPLRRPKTCGKYFDQYRVSDSVPVSRGGRKGRGLRCVLKVGRKNTTWFGNGYWVSGKNTYSHLGTRGARGYGAGDICGTSFGPTCNNFPYGSLKLNLIPGGFKVTGAWRELWK
ncbi:MAG: hypothetical protein AAF378_11545 [Cyanobacteria bacterium P01_A01_bin.84]